MGENRRVDDGPAKRSDWLSLHRRDVTSQSGEDGVIEKIFDVIGETNRWCVEFGAGNGILYNNTYNLLANRGWSGVQIEADPRDYARLAGLHAGNPRVICLNAKLAIDGPHSIDNILSSTPVPPDLDLISIDVDGADYHIWDSMERYVPRVVLIEYNFTIPPDIDFVQPRDMRLKQGSSILSLTRLARKKGYALVSMTDYNAFFVQEKYFGLFGIGDNSPSRLCVNRRYFTRLFQLYDGTLVLSGYDRLLWHDIELGERRVQALPRFLRVYPPDFNFFRRQAVKIWRFGPMGLLKRTIKHSFIYPLVRPLHERRLGRLNARGKRPGAPGRDA